MILKLSTWLLVALTGGVLVAGCGSSSSTTSSSQATAATLPAPATSTGATGSQAPNAPASTATTTTPSTTPSKPTTSTPRPTPAPAAPPSGQQAAALCRKAVQAQATLPASSRAKLEKTCEKASGGGTSALHQVARELCAEIIKTSHIPPGPAQETALAVCKRE